MKPLETADLRPMIEEDPIFTTMREASPSISLRSVSLASEGVRDIRREMLEPPRIRPDVVLHHLAVPDQDVLVDHQALHPHRSAGMDLVGADPHLRPLAEAVSVGESGGCVDEDVGRIDSGDERGGRLHIAGDDGVGMM